MSRTKAPERVRASLGSRRLRSCSLAAFHGVSRKTNPFGNLLLLTLQRALKHENCPQHLAESTEISWMGVVAAGKLLGTSTFHKLVGQPGVSRRLREQPWGQNAPFSLSPTQLPWNNWRWWE